ncbi:PREDICTED: uncharacterized protein LOC104593741 [Nelumbo nucifera]|uniref:Uncharacterized protein LOC104593741 n=1 Tax=Nelumbo nucifera TaxID=4432 RepID=A0A1U7ZEC0_NELNU|nr:PREDICTED: uncharacterized protein LOC104593741 [Nelumbo nucifera]
MADPEIAQAQKQTPFSPLSKPPGPDGEYHHDSEKPKDHCVSFSESLDDLDEGKHSREVSWRCCCTCCGGACIIILLCLIIIVMSAGLILRSYFSNLLPEFRIDKASVSELNLITTIEGKSYLSASTDLSIVANNRNSRFWFCYEPLITVGVSSDDVDLGQDTLQGFSQPSDNVTTLNVHTRVSRSVIDDKDGTILKANFDEKKMVLDVVLQTTVNVILGRVIMDEIPIKIVCAEVSLSMTTPKRCDVFPNIFEDVGERDY